MPKVTVVTGYYNRSPVLFRTIRSILRQSYEDIEFIVFDDASTDGTADRLLELQEDFDDSRLKVVLQTENTGFVSGLKSAISSSDSEYIAIQGSGDVSRFRRIDKQVSLLEDRPEVGLVGSWYLNVAENGTVYRPRRPIADGMGIEKLREGNVFSHGEVMFRRATYNEVGGYRTAFKFSQDYDLWLRMAQICELATVPSFEYERYVQTDGVSYSPAKVIEQAAYARAASILSSLSGDDAEAAFDQLHFMGPNSILPQDDPALESMLTSAIIRIAFWGDHDSATELLGRIKPSVARRILLRSVIAITGASGGLGGSLPRYLLGFRNGERP